MPVPDRKVRILYASLAIWSLASLLLTEKVSYAVFGSDSVPHLVGTWLILCLGPVLPVLWLWIMERSPWSGFFLVPVILIGGLIALPAFGYGGFRYYSDSLRNIGYVAVMWSLAACFNAWLLKGATRVDALSWQRTEQVPAKPVVIDHGKYLRLLDDQAVSGFPGVMRVRRHFLETLPECVPAFTNHDQAACHDEMAGRLAYARRFMLEKISCEFAFLCAVSFLERMCGPDFRYTKQYQSIVDQMVQIDAVDDEGPFPGLSRKAVTAAELEAVAKVLEDAREREAARRGKRTPDSDLTIALSALVLLLREQLAPQKQDEEFNSHFTRMIKGGMNKMREMFSRQKTEINFQA